MRLTNRLKLPQPLVDAVKNDSYDRGEADISVTTLIKPPRMVALEKKHWHEIEEDVSERIWSLMGQVTHGILERANETGIAERRLSASVLGWQISGQMDRYIDGTLQDYKLTTAYKFKDGKAPQEFEEQLNCYAYLLRANGHAVHNLEIVGILRDWSKLEAKRDAGYPQRQVLVVPVNLWPEDLAKQFVFERVALHQRAQREIPLPLCTDIERWAKPDIWAVTKKLGGRAIKLHGNEMEATAHAITLDSAIVEHRPGSQMRCENYCSVSQFCGQFKEIQETGQSKGESA